MASWHAKVPVRRIGKVAAGTNLGGNAAFGDWGPADWAAQAFYVTVLTKKRSCVTDNRDWPE